MANVPRLLRGLSDSMAVLLQVCRKKPTFICYSCKHFITASKWGEEQSCWSPPFPKGFLYTLQTWFIPALSAHMLRHLLGSGSMSRPCWWKLGIISKATDQFPSASQLLPPFLHQCKSCNNNQPTKQKSSNHYCFLNPEHGRLAVFSSVTGLLKSTVEEQFPVKVSLPVADATHH